MLVDEDTFVVRFSTVIQETITICASMVVTSITFETKTPKTKIHRKKSFETQSNSFLCDAAHGAFPLPWIRQHIT